MRWVGGQLHSGLVDYGRRMFMKLIVYNSLNKYLGGHQKKVRVPGLRRNVISNIANTFLRYRELLSHHNGLIKYYVYNKHKASHSDTGQSSRLMFLIVSEKNARRRSEHKRGTHSFAHQDFIAVLSQLLGSSNVRARGKL